MSKELSLQPLCDWPIARRAVLQGGTAAGVFTAFGDLAWAGEVPPAFASLIDISMRVNGESRSLTVDPRSSLLDVLRETLALTGAKKGCDHGQCGACTVHLDGQRIAACLTPVVQASGREVVTIEGVGAEGLHPMQQAFIDHDALQCGYCTPGQIMAAIGCVNEGHAGSDQQIREYMSGNLCRCGAYPGIVAAIRLDTTLARGSQITHTCSTTHQRSRWLFPRGPFRMG